MDGWFPIPWAPLHFPAAEKPIEAVEQSTKRLRPGCYLSTSGQCQPKARFQIWNCWWFTLFCWVCWWGDFPTFTSRSESDPALFHIFRNCTILLYPRWNWQKMWKLWTLVWMNNGVLNFQREHFILWRDQWRDQCPPGYWSSFDSFIWFILLSADNMHSAHFSCVAQVARLFFSFTFIYFPKTEFDSQTESQFTWMCNCWAERWHLTRWRKARCAEEEIWEVSKIFGLAPILPFPCKWLSHIIVGVWEAFIPSDPSSSHTSSRILVSSNKWQRQKKKPNVD